MPSDTSKLTDEDLEIAASLDRYLRRRLRWPPSEGCIEGWVLRFLVLRKTGEDTECEKLMEDTENRPA